MTLFDKIVQKKIPANIIYEDDLALAFRDIAPVAPTHFLVIPKDRKGLSGLSKATDDHAHLLGHLLIVAAKVAAQEGLTEGYRAVINDGKFGSKTSFQSHFVLYRSKCVPLPHSCNWREATLMASRCLIAGGAASYFMKINV